MKSTLALCLSLLALATASYAALRPAPTPEPRPAESPGFCLPPIFADPQIYPEPFVIEQLPEASMPSAWDPEDR